MKGICGREFELSQVLLLADIVAKAQKGVGLVSRRRRKQAAIADRCNLKLVRDPSVNSAYGGMAPTLLLSRHAHGFARLCHADISCLGSDVFHSPAVPNEPNAATKKAAGVMPAACRAQNCL